MDSQVTSVEEKLVPFVEGALAEADRREVIQALSRQPALNQEIRLLRETILMLRTQTARGMTYQSSVEAPAEQVVDFALDSEQWTRQSSRQFQLHILESASLAEELSILKELEQTLQQHVEISTSVLAMPVALRAALQEAYGKPAAEPIWRWLAGINFKVAASAMAGCLVLFGALSAGRYAHPIATRASAAPDSLNPSLAAQVDYGKLKTGPAPDSQKTNLRDGVIGTLPDVWPKPARSSNYTKPEIAPTLAPLPVVAVNLPAAPEISRAESKADANYNVAEDVQQQQVKPAVRHPVPATPKDKLAIDEAIDTESEAPPAREAQNADTEAKDPFEVAMLPVAKKLVEEWVGEATVQMERKDDGHLLVTIRPVRSLSSEEVDNLRKVVREKLELKDEDTVVIRQP